MAQHDLMRSEATKLKLEEDIGKAQERTWLFSRGQELGLKVLEEPTFLNMQKQLRLSRWGQRAFKSQHAPKRISLRTPLDIASAIRARPLNYPSVNIPKKKRYHKNHTQRSSKTMRSIRHLKHIKVFSFPDSVWKVRK